MMIDTQIEFLEYYQGDNMKIHASYLVLPTTSLSVVRESLHRQRAQSLNQEFDYAYFVERECFKFSDAVGAEIFLMFNYEYAILGGAVSNPSGDVPAKPEFKSA